MLLNLVPDSVTQFQKWSIAGIPIKLVVEETVYIKSNKKCSSALLALYFEHAEVRVAQNVQKLYYSVKSIYFLNSFKVKPVQRG